MKILIPMAVIVAVLLVYAIWGRDWLKSKDWARPFFAWIEPIEIALFKKSSVILFARLKVVTGILLTYLTTIGGLDLSSIAPFVPEKHHHWVSIAVMLMPLLLSVVGAIDEWLRKKTTLPIEVVAVPEKVIVENEKVAAAVEAAVIAKTEAVAVVKEEKVV